MITGHTQVEDLLMEIQDAFLDAPELELTLSDAQRRFGLDGQTCRELLGTLVETGVLMRTDDGRYVRFFPRLARRSLRTPAVAPKTNGHAVRAA